MPTFIKRRVVPDTRTDADGHEYTVNTLVNYKRDELVELLQNARHLFIEVPESHAQNVIRDQGKYQEVWDDIIEEADAVVEEETVIAPPPADSADTTTDAESGDDLELNLTPATESAAADTTTAEADAAPVQPGSSQPKSRSEQKRRQHQQRGNKR